MDKGELDKIIEKTKSLCPSIITTIVRRMSTTMTTFFITIATMIKITKTGKNVVEF